MLNLVYICTNWIYVVLGSFCRNKSWKWTYVVFDLFFEKNM